MGMGSRPCLHGVRLCAGIDEGMGPRIREDKRGGGGWILIPVFTGRLFAGIDEGMGFCMREDTGGDAGG